MPQPRARPRAVKKGVAPKIRLAFAVLMVATLLPSVFSPEIGHVDAAATPNISAPADVLVGEADGYVDLPVTLSAPGASTVTVHYATANSSATSGPCANNYLGVSGTLTFTPGVTTQVVRVDINDCHLAGFRSFTFNLSTPINGTIIRPGTRIGIVGDDNTTATPLLYARNVDVDNSAGSISIPVLLGGPAGTVSLSTVTVSYTTVNGAAIAGTDYTATSGTLTFAPGQTVANVTVPITNRAEAAPTRSFSMVLSAPMNATIAQATGVVTIGASGGDATATPNISAPADVLVGEADGYVDLPVTLSAPGASTVTVVYATANSSATSGACNNTYRGVSGTLTFTPGVTTQVVRVDINDCHLAGFRSFTFNLSTPINGTIIRPGTRIGIVGDDVVASTPGLYVRDGFVGNGGGTMRVPVLLGGPGGTALTTTVTVDYATHDDSAIAGFDYAASSGSLTFGPGQTVASVPVVINDRPGAQPDRRFTIRLTSPTNAAIVDGSGVVTIGASGGTAVASPGVSAPADLMVGEADGYVDLPVTLSAPGLSTLSVHYATANGTATSGPCANNYRGVSGTLTFTPGVTAQVVRIDINDCGLANPGAFTFNLSSPSNATIARAAAQVSIVSGSLFGGTQAVYVPGAILTGAQYNALFRASPLSSFTLVGAPSWLAINSAGAVTGVPPDGTTSFSFSVLSTGSTPVGPFTVDINAGTSVSGTVVDTDGTVISGAPVDVCQAVTGWECQKTATSFDGSFSLDAAIGASIVLTAYPPSGSLLVRSSIGPLDVPAGGLSSLSIVETGPRPLPSGLRINGQSTMPGVNWAAPSTATLTGCPGGIATVSVIGKVSATGKWESKVIFLTETPSGSGNYVGTIPPFYPVHGGVHFDSSVSCPPVSPLLPSSGPASGGNKVDVTGAGFTGAIAVLFGGSPASNFLVEEDNLVHAVAPQGTGTVPVTVVTRSARQVIDQYTYIAVESISPNAGMPSGGTPVTITGTGLAAATSVYFGTVPAAFIQTSDTEIQAVTPPGAGTVDVTVKTEFGGTTPVITADQFTYITTGGSIAAASTFNPAAPLSVFSPNPPTLTVGPLVSSADAQKIYSYIWGHLSGLKDYLDSQVKPALQIGIAGLQGICGSKDTTVSLLSDPIKALVDGLIVAGGIDFTIQSAIAVYAAGYVIWPVIAIAAPVAIGTVWAANHFIDASTKAAVGAYLRGLGCPGIEKPNGLIDPSGTVLDTNGNPVSGATVTISRSDSAAGPFAAVDASSPGIAPAINPETTASDGVFHWDVISGFYEVQASSPGCSDANATANSSATIGPYPVPPPQLGLVITLACPGAPPPPTPSVTSLGTHSGPTAGGTSVMIFGTGFTPSSAATFGGRVASVSYLSPEALEVLSPPGAGLVDVIVHNSGNSSAASASGEFFFGDPPVLTGLSVNHGPASGGTAVTVSGSGFSSATLVAFGGLPASSFTVVSDTEISATAPAHSPGVVGVQVLTPAGVSATASSDEFTFEPDPALDSDGDGCADIKELGDTASHGGQRDPTNPWDFYDVPAPALRLGYTGQEIDHGIGVTTDVVALLAYAGLRSSRPDYTADYDGNGLEDGFQYDRSASTTPDEPWRTGPPDGGIGVTTDVVAMLAQTGNRCF